MSVEASIDIAIEKDVLFRRLEDGFHPPDVVEHRDVVRAPGGGHSCTTVHRLRSQLIAQHNTLVEFIRNERLVYRMTSPTGRFIQTSDLEAIPDGTRLLFRIDVVGGDKRIWGRRVLKYDIHRQIDKRLAWMKRTLEGA